MVLVPKTLKVLILEVHSKFKSYNFITGGSWRDRRGKTKAERRVSGWRWRKW